MLNTGTFEDPIVVKSAGEELQCGCTGSPADSHHVRWCVVCFDPFSLGQQVGLGHLDVSLVPAEHANGNTNLQPVGLPRPPIRALRRMWQW